MSSQFRTSHVSPPPDIYNIILYNLSHQKETYKINTNGRDVGFGVGIVSKPQKKTGFTNTRVSNKKEFKEIIAVDFMPKYHQQRGIPGDKREKKQWLE